MVTQTRDIGDVRVSKRTFEGKVMELYNPAHGDTVISVSGPSGTEELSLGRAHKEGFVLDIVRSHLVGKQVSYKALRIAKRPASSPSTEVYYLRVFDDSGNQIARYRDSQRYGPQFTGLS